MTSKNPGRRISIRSVRKNPPDLGKLGRALLALAIAQAEADAEAQDPKTTAAPENETQQTSEDTA